jgi:MerR family transcriptional regulator, light-induced transcriptional regulator
MMKSARVVGVRVGELARRVGVAPETLRAWERRYGVLRPSRTAGGYRVYGSEDELRAQRMRELIESGWAAGEAAQAVTADETASAIAETERVPPFGADADHVLDALLGFDCATVQAAFDRVFAERSMDAALREVVLPALHEIGERWARAEVTVAQEHFATEVITSRLRSLCREWDHGLGPRAILACPSGERHDIGLLCCGLALHRRGWRVTYLGADTPTNALAGAVEAIDPAVVVIGAVQRHPLRAAAPALAELSARLPIAVGGAGASPELVTAAGARQLPGDPVTAADALTESAVAAAV